MADDFAGPASAQAPAAPDTPAIAPSVSAEHAAAETGDFEAFDRAHVASRQGKPVPDVPRPAAPAQPATADGLSSEAASAPVQPVSKRQQVINDYERRVQEQGRRIAELEYRTRAAQTPASAPGQEPLASARAQPGPPNGQPPQETPKQRVARYLGLPDAPKVDDFDTYPEFNAAQTLFLQDQLHAEQTALRGQHEAQQQRHQALVARDQSFRERLTAAKEADPAFVTSLSEDARTLGGIDHALRSGVAPGPQHIIGELVYDSPHAVAFLRHISADPAALAQLVTPPAFLQRLPPQVRAKAHIDHLVTEFRRLEGRLAYEEALAARDGAASETPAPPRSVSSAPPPPPTLGKAGRSTDPVASALARGDFEAFDAAEVEKRVQRRAGRAS